MSGVALDHINIRCTDVDDMKDFYGRLLALEIGPRPPFSSEGYWLYSGKEPLVHLVQRPPHERVASQADVALNHVAFRCRDPDSAGARLRDMGISFRQTTIPETGIVQFFLHDPEGVGIELNFPP